jgi:hypothetical protein
MIAFLIKGKEQKSPGDSPITGWHICSAIYHRGEEDERRTHLPIPLAAGIPHDQFWIHDMSLSRDFRIVDTREQKVGSHLPHVARGYRNRRERRTPQRGFLNVVKTHHGEILSGRLALRVKAEHHPESDHVVVTEGCRGRLRSVE